MSMTFADLSLMEPLLLALAEAGYVSPTPIQAQSIPLLLEGRDLLGLAQTGTGKTASFALPLLHRLAANPRPAPKGGARILVLAPTRELVSQIADGFENFGRHLPLASQRYLAASADASGQRAQGWCGYSCCRTRTPAGPDRTGAL